MQSSELFWFENFENLPQKFEIPTGGASILVIKSWVKLSTFVNIEFQPCPFNYTAVVTKILFEIKFQFAKSCSVFLSLLEDDSKVVKW